MSILTHFFERCSRIVTTTAALATLWTAGTVVHAQTPVVFGDVITEPGVYFLAGHQSGDGGVGITIESDDVVLLLTRFTLRADSSNIGILSVGNDNVAIYGGRVTGCSDGIAIEDGERCTVQGTRIDHAGTAGLFLRDVRDSWFVRLRADHNGRDGVESVDGSGNRFLSILAHDNRRDGILLRDEIDPPVGSPSGSMDGNKVKLCWASQNGHDGIRLLDSNANELSRNQCPGNDGVGIRLDTTSDGMDSAVGPGVTGSHDNRVARNWCVFNDEGILVEWGSSDNTLTNNTALANIDDLVDENMDTQCVNAWHSNVFLFKDGAGVSCIF